LTVLQRVGGSLGTAIIAVVLQGQTAHARTAAAAASGFAHTYWWVMGVTLLALVPTLVLARIEQRAKARGEASVMTPADEPMLEAA
jgi:formate-dependent nitrite reductase membrane component NrfD